MRTSPNVHLLTAFLACRLPQVGRQRQSRYSAQWTCPGCRKTISERLHQRPFASLSRARCECPGTNITGVALPSQETEETLSVSESLAGTKMKSRRSRELSKQRKRRVQESFETSCTQLKSTTSTVRLLSTATARSFLEP